MVRKIVPTLLLGAVLSIVQATAPSLAYAGCPLPDPASAVARVGAPFKLQAYAAAAGLDTDDGRDGTIVGLWEFMFVSKGNPGIPDDTVLDSGYATWHDDGTEIMNSSRPPKTGSFCMGVWKKTGHSRYKLNHKALSWDPSGDHFVGPAHIHEEVTVGRGGDTYAGTFTIDQFDPAGALLVHLGGHVAAHRITADE